MSYFGKANFYIKIYLFVVKVPSFFSEDMSQNYHFPPQGDMSGRLNSNSLLNRENETFSITALNSWPYIYIYIYIHQNIWHLVLSLIN